MRIGRFMQILLLIAFGNLQAATIHETIDQGDSAAAAAMLDANPALLNDRLPNGRTPLHTAAYNGKLGIVQLLLDRGADPNATTNTGSAPLHGATLYGHEAVVKLLVAGGANVNTANQSGYTPLVNAATFGSVPAMKCLIDASASIEGTTANGMIPLHAAINSCKPEAVEYLLNAGANPNSIPSGGESALMTAVLWTRWDPNRTEAIPEILRSLLKRGADPNWALPNGRTVIMIAATSNDTTVLKVLLGNKANPNTITSDGTTAFCEAVKSGQLNSVKFLIGRGARTDGLDINFGYTPLHLAVLQGEVPLVEAVLPVTSNPNAVDSTGMTPLDIANRYGHTRIADVLRKGGVKANAKKEQPPSSTYLVQRPKEGEANLWYLGNCGYLIKTRNHSLIFDYWTRGTRPTEPSLANGFIVPSDFASDDVTVFVSHEHSDHFDSTIFSWSGKIPKLQYVFGFVPDSLAEGARQGYAGQPYEYVGPGMTKTVDGMQVMAVRSNDAGAGFVINVDGLTIYHAGDLAGWVPNQREGFTSQIDSIDAAVDSVDIALVNVTGCHHQDTVALAEGTVYTLTKLHPKLVIPTHGSGREYYYSQFMSKFKGQFPNLASFCPLRRGDAAKFTNNRKSARIELL
jgi:ankyrin repeat protein/L-ascorbate metabolism protein UlaG (beta-lactamase superfamily)